MHYAIVLNGKVIKTGHRENGFSDVFAEEAFVLKMQQKYMRNDDDCVEVWFR